VVQTGRCVIDKDTVMVTRCMNGFVAFHLGPESKQGERIATTQGTELAHHSSILA
jgi:hypothetical protein